MIRIDYRIFLKISSFIIFMQLVLSCSRFELKQAEPELLQIPSESRLDKILQKGSLDVIIDYNSVDYFIYRGQPMGFQYEMMDFFAREMGLKLKIRVVEGLDEAFSKLYDGKADIVANGITVTNDRRRLFDFSDPLLITRQVLVQKLPKDWRRLSTRDELEARLIRSSLELSGKTIHVQEHSVFRKRLEVLADEMGDTIIIIDDKRGVEELIKAVSDGQIEYTVSDEHTALVLESIYDEIDVRTPLSFPQKISWAVGKEQNNELLLEINKWLAEFSVSASGRMLYNKYFSGSRISSRHRSDFHSMSGGRLSPYDGIIRVVAGEIGWDWRLLASLIYQESEFKPDVVSWAGAYGLMQLMPVVMEQFGIDSMASPEDQVRVGGRFIQYLDLQISESITDPEERIKFILASYNSGIGHVLDARRLARKYNKNPDMWTDHVDFFMQNKSKPAFYRDPVVYYGYARGEETHQFVVNVLERYEHYKNLIPD